MSVSYQAFYQVSAKDREALLDNYRNRHIPIRLEKLIVHEQIDWFDGHDDPTDAFLLIVEFVFADTAAMEAGITSERRLAAKQSFANFPEFSGKIWHQGMSIREHFFPQRKLSRQIKHPRNLTQPKTLQSLEIHKENIKCPSSQS